MAFTGQLGTADSQLGKLVLGSAGLPASVVGPSGIASGEVFGTPTLDIPEISGAGAIPSGETFGTPALTPGQVILAPSGIPSAETFGDLRLGLFILPQGWDDATPVGTPSVRPVVGPGGIASAEAFGALIITRDRFVTVTEVDANMSASIRETTPTTPDAESVYLRVNGTAAAKVYAFLDVRRTVPIGVGAQVFAAFISLRKAEPWSTGTHILTVEPINDPWEAQTLTWNTQPGVRSAEAVTITVPGGGLAGDVIEADVTAMLAASVAADDAAGSRWYGVRVRADTAAENKMWSSFAAPEVRPDLSVEWSIPPAAPTDLLPNAARYVSETKPELVARFFDPDNEDKLHAIQVQVGTASDFVTPLYDSGRVAHSHARFDLVAPPAGAPATPTLVAGTLYYWRMKTWDNHGVEGDWSETASFNVKAKGVVDLTSPSGSTVTSPVPTFSYTFTPSGTETQKQVEVQVERLDGGVWLAHYLLAKHVTTLTSFTLPDAYRLKEGQTYRVAVRVWDSVDREDMAGDRAFLEDSQQFTLVGVSV